MCVNVYIIYDEPSSANDAVKWTRAQCASGIASLRAAHLRERVCEGISVYVCYDFARIFLYLDVFAFFFEFTALFGSLRPTSSLLINH